DQGDARAQGDIGRGELRPGDTGADDDEMFGQLRKVVELLPGKDSLTVRLGPGQLTRRGSGRHQHDVRAVALLTVLGPHDESIGADEACAAMHDLDAFT